MARVGFLASYYLLNCLLVAEPFSILLTFPLFLLCCFNMYSIRSRHIVVADMVWLIAYLFFVIGPCQVVLSGHIGKATGPVAGISFSDVELFETALIIFLFFLTVTVTQHLYRLTRTPSVGRSPSFYRLGPSSALPLLIVNISAFLIYVALSGGMSNVFAARYNQRPEDISALSVAFMALQIISTFLLAILVKTDTRAHLARAALMLSVVLLAVTQNPYNTARYFLLASWLPLIFIFLGGRLGVLRFYTALFFGVMVVMPILSITSRFGSEISQAFQEVDFQDALFHIPFVDVFDMLAYEVKYLWESDFYWGQKTLGVLFFFVPRAVWPDKATLLALDMGTQLAGAKIAGTANLSLFVAGEFYADFGLAGVVIGASLVTLLLLRLGRLMFVVNGLELGSFIFISALPILVRGPLGAVAPLTFTEFIWFWLVVFLLARRSHVPVLTNISQIRPSARHQLATGRE